MTSGGLLFAEDSCSSHFSGVLARCVIADYFSSGFFLHEPRDALRATPLFERDSGQFVLELVEVLANRLRRFADISSDLVCLEISRFTVCLLLQICSDCLAREISHESVPLR